MSDCCLELIEVDDGLDFVLETGGAGPPGPPGRTDLASLTDVQITAPADGEVLTYVGADSKWENKHLPKVGAGVYRSTNQSISNGSDVALSFDTARFNNGSVFAGGSPTRLTAPVAGVYLTRGAFELDVNATGHKAAKIRVNGGSVVAIRRIVPDGTLTDYLEVSKVLHLAATDYVELLAFLDGSFSLNVLYDAAFSPEFELVLLQAD